MFYITVKQLAQAVNACQRIRIDELYQAQPETGKQAENRPQKDDTKQEKKEGRENNV